jgi:hypothetical protein
LSGIFQSPAILCAVDIRNSAAPANRDILKIGVSPRQLAEPAVGDKMMLRVIGFLSLAMQR